MTKRFNFGVNWGNYSENSLDKKKFNDAKDSLGVLIGERNIQNKTVIDVGCGSGIFALAAKNIGARKVVGFDVSDESIITSKKNKARLGAMDVEFFKKSILEESVALLGKFDIVYSWGVLHHTGEMWRALLKTTELVQKRGTLVLAIYNKHWTSPIWKLIKIIFNYSPPIIRKGMIYFFYVVIYIAKFLTTFQNPLKKRRGMSFYYDVIDWIGGYPYEYASTKEITEYIEKFGFKVVKINKTIGMTGCNEFVFVKIGE